jgi:hypothetical protein
VGRLTDAESRHKRSLTHQKGETNMGGTFNFDQMLPSIPDEAGGKPNPKRQVEIFTHNSKLCLRVGPINEKDSGENRYTVQLSGKDARELIASVEAGVSYLGL